MNALIDGIRAALLLEKQGIWCGHILPHRDPNTELAPGNYWFNACPGKALERMAGLTTSAGEDA